MALTHRAVEALKLATKAYKKGDEKELYLQVTPQGAKYWRFKYRLHKKEKLLAIGLYPDLSLAQAREKRDEAKKLLAEGIDPGEFKKQVKQVAIENATNSFGANHNHPYRSSNVKKHSRNTNIEWPSISLGN